ncbi:hypothetical protein CsSME_00002067 [Camellia sinensis var. sinensis]
MFFLFLNCVLFSLTLFLVSSSISSFPQSAIYLLHFRNSLPEPSQLLLPWNQSTSSSSSHCQWPGVSCYSNINLHVKSLNLSGFGISGTLNDSVPNLCRLPHLLSIDLSGNNFTGSLSLMLGNCSQLNTILLNDNAITGPIPPEIFHSNSKQLLKLDLGFNFLSGTVPPEVGLCTNLEYLGLYDNFLTGQIPSQLFSLENLRFLYLSTNNFTGALPDFSSSCSISDLRIHENSFSSYLPPSLGSCHNLSVFYASYNSIEGIILPEIFKGLSQLQCLYLANNNLQGEIPETLWGLENLQEIELSRNNLNGSISEKIGQSHLLSIIALSYNNLIGQIPSSIGNLRNLNTLGLSNNMLNGSIPPELSNCTSLLEIGLQNNFIEGAIPSEICSLQSLQIFYAFDNHIEGQIPQQIGKMTSLVELALYNNSITGTIPYGITSLTSLTFLSLAHNDLTGEVPYELGKNNMPGLVKLDLTGNRFYGPIPSGLCAGNSLSFLILGNNRFNGTFPVNIGKCKSLRRVILSSNLLQGNIPENLDMNIGVSYLDIRGNLFTGQIPKVFGFWSNLSMIDFSGNMFSGSIPPELGRLRNLQTLKLSSNRLVGRIPSDLGRCTEMTKMDLSNNSLSESIPSEIITNVKLQSLILQDNNLSGLIPDSFSSSQSLFELNLGNNMLEDPIPCSLSKLQHFNLVLNLSNNRFSGEIPKCLRYLDKLEILDLSSNSFSGAIPPELNNMISLSFVNISFNRLSGKIPDSWEKLLSSYPGSFLGNPGLCLLGTESNYCSETRKSHSRLWMLVGVTIGVILSVALLSIAAYILVIRGCQDQFASHRSLLYDSRSRTEDLPEDLTFDDIMRATEGWSDKYVIGRGKHGTVYRTESVKSRKHWAIKKVELSETNFSIEMMTLSLIRHRNVVRMAGYCIKDGYGFIVTEYMPSGTLFDVLHSRSKTHMVLDWETRYRIAIGIAQGLSYLHHDCVPQIVHRDVKSDNILLDSEMEPKIGDFGTAKLVRDSDGSSTKSVIVGTLGYIAPENGYSTQLTEKCDVYSYGVILLELVCRRLPVDPCFEEGLDIVSWVRKNLQKKDESFWFLDEEVGFWDVNEQWKAVKLLDLALQCTEQVAQSRPSMRDVVGSLTKLNVSSSISSFPQSAIYLLHFRDSLPEPSQLLLPWNQSTSSSSSHCQWPGVSCYSNINSHVKSLMLCFVGRFKE